MVIGTPRECLVGLLVLALGLPFYLWFGRRPLASR